MVNLMKIGKINISIMGLMGSGKSSIGKELSKIYKLKFVDTDYEIEKETGKSINDLFSSYGEKYFRNIEEKVCLKVLNYKNCIISLGGGSIINKEIRNIIKKNSYSIFLNVKIDVLLKRLTNTKKRPLLLNVDKKKFMNDLYEKRKKYYINSDLIIQNNFEKKDVLKEIKLKIKDI